MNDGTPWAGAAPLAAWGLNVLDDVRRGTGLVLDVMGHVPRTSPSVVTAPGTRGTAAFLPRAPIRTARPCC